MKARPAFCREAHFPGVCDAEAASPERMKSGAAAGLPFRRRSFWEDDAERGGFAG
jgi:hypothetical protein